MDDTYNFVYKNENTENFLNSCIYHTFYNTHTHIQIKSINEKGFMKKMKDKLSGIRNMIVDEIF
jgi:hypothetical protein